MITEKDINLNDILDTQFISSFEDAEKFVSLLTGCDGKIREIVAFKINYFFQHNKGSEFFQNEVFFNTFISAVIDVNPNVCRFIISILKFIENKNSLFNLTVSKINEIIPELEHIPVKKNQFDTKKMFNLYWLLEALNELVSDDNILDVIDILTFAANFYNYTIREKAAKIISTSALNDEPILNLSKQLSQDENFYVKRFFNYE